MTAPRPPLVAGNWKMNPTSSSEAVELARDVADQTEGLPVRSVICPPSVYLEAVSEAVRDREVEVGAQTMHAEESGAFTGEISPVMLMPLVGYVIIGHSERRQYDNETDAAVAAKVR